LEELGFPLNLRKKFIPRLGDKSEFEHGGILVFDQRFHLPGDGVAFLPYIPKIFTLEYFGNIGKKIWSLKGLF